MLSYRFRLYPSRQAEEALFQHLDLCRWLYNRLLEELNRAKKENRKLTQKDTQALIVTLKVEKPELGQVYSKVLQMVNYQLWSNIRALSMLKRNGRRVGKLRFKGKWFKTLNYNQSGFRLEGKKLILSKVGMVNSKLHRPIKGNVKGVVVKRELSGRWFAVFQVENFASTLRQTRRRVGLDMGVKHFLSDSDGRQVENPKFYERSLKRLRTAHRILSRKKKGSQNRAKAKVKLARAYEKVVNQRDDFLHKISRFYINNYDVIVVEDLNIAGMVRNRNLSGKILEDNGVVVGYLYVTFVGIKGYDITIAELMDIAVAPDHQRRGIGFMMMERIEKIAKERGATLLRSCTGIENVASQRLHEKFGFKPYRIDYEKVLL